LINITKENYANVFEKIQKRYKFSLVNVICISPKNTCHIITIRDVQLKLNTIDNGFDIRGEMGKSVQLSYLYVVKAGDSISMTHNSLMVNRAGHSTYIFHFV
jgi:hypothetical protein